VPGGHRCLLNTLVLLYRRLTKGKISLNVKRVLHLSAQLYETSLRQIFSEMLSGLQAGFLVKLSLDLPSLNEDIPYTELQSVRWCRNIPCTDGLSENSVGRSRNIPCTNGLSNNSVGRSRNIPCTDGLSYNR
jgi:hypothetical protein